MFVKVYEVLIKIFSINFFQIIDLVFYNNESNRFRSNYALKSQRMEEGVKLLSSYFYFFFFMVFLKFTTLSNRHASQMEPNQVCSMIIVNSKMNKIIFYLFAISVLCNFITSIESGKYLNDGIVFFKVIPEIPSKYLLLVNNYENLTNHYVKNEGLMIPQPETSIDKDCYWHRSVRFVHFILNQN